MRRRLIAGSIALVLGGCGLSVVGAASDGTPDAAALLDATTPADAIPPADVAVDTYVPPAPGCTGNSVQCCNGSPCPAGTTLCVSNTCVATLLVSASIDGADDLVLKGNTVLWSNVEFDRPGTTKLNTTSWTPGWPNGTIRCGCSSLTTTISAALANHMGTVTVSKIGGRGSVTIVEQPTDAMPVAKIRFDDSGDDQGGQDNYTALITYPTR